MHARLRTLSLLATLALSLPAVAAPAANEAATKPVKTVVQSVRYSKDDLALKQLANDEQGRFLLGEDWAKGTDAQRKEFTQLFHSLFSKIAFPKVRDNFKNLESITYTEPAVEGDKANVKSTVVINHPMKKQEMKLQYSVVKEGGGWKVLDVSVLGDSMLTGIRDDQVRPILKQGGWDHLLDLMRKKDAELSKK
ncbi:MlaC/ttg2D family ABC transporter substrate-binding protein [[Archangium] primigenium]|uniref:MlaC/ttg2D family ABC transporter substrate-binding protein n=1 Tax=Melittangium TaxID=44 RepID=UPI001956B569|nr:ABC transporter substrate-binding protein [Archangium primigenium]MBM7113406.1 ABC transporter substrate-binding protein [Archangium primigenium]